MKPGIKPSHLWHWTPRKWFEAIINDRLQLKDRDQRSKIDMIKTNAVVLALFTGLMYSFGLFCPKTIIKNFLRERSCDASAYALEEEEPEPKEKKKSKRNQPCPPKIIPQIPKCD